MRLARLDPTGDRILKRSLLVSAAAHALALSGLAARLPAWVAPEPVLLTVRLTQATPAQPLPVRDPSRTIQSRSLPPDQAAVPARIATPVPDIPAEPVPVSLPTTSAIALPAAPAVTAASVPKADVAESAAAPPVAATRPADPSPLGPPPLIPPRFDADYLDNPAPAYPALSRRLGEEGRVVLRVQVGADGQPREVEVQAGSGYPRLDRAARETVTRWRFVAARRGGEAVESWVLVPVSFRLN